MATIEDFDTSTKTSMTETNRVVWNTGDELLIFQGHTLGDRYKVSDASAGTSNGTFSIVRGDDGVTDGSFVAGTELSRNVAVYPYSEEVVIDNVIEEDTGEPIAYALKGVEIPAVQNYEENSFANGAFPMIAVTVDKPDHRLKFNNAAGAMKINLKGTDRIRSIKIEGNNGEKLSGNATVTAWFEDGKKPTLEMESDAGTSVILDCGNGVQLSKDVVTSFVIALPPVEFSEGFTVSVTTCGSLLKELEASVFNMVERSSILSMPPVSLDGMEGTLIHEYIDEYGVNHGSGVEIDGVVWAPVNCGYHETDYPYGKLYQWGRKYGQGYSGDLCDIEGNDIGQISDATVPDIYEGPVSVMEGQSSEFRNIFMTGRFDWTECRFDKLWNMGTTLSPIKTEFDPCPAGWRVPVYNEICDFLGKTSEWTIDENGYVGCCFTGNDPYTDSETQLFLPAAGRRDHEGNGLASRRGSLGDYWSSDPGDNGAASIMFTNNRTWIYGHSARSSGCSVRCVRDSDSDMEAVSVEEVEIKEKSLTMYPDTRYQLTYEIVSGIYDESDIILSSDNQLVAEVDYAGEVIAVSDGTAIITASAGALTASCSVTVKSTTVVADKKYIADGNDYGYGIAIGNIVWAPVNCGYHVTDYPYGKLYQWGRKYGQGYYGPLWDGDGNFLDTVSDATYPEGDNLVNGPVSLSEGADVANEYKFFLNSVYPYDWSVVQDDCLWNSGSEDFPVKTENDPCPDGWRVPTHNEIRILSSNYSKRTTDIDGYTGFYFTGEYPYMEDIPSLFLPAAGYRGGSGGAYYRGSSGKYWSSRPDRSSYYLYFYDNNVVITDGNGEHAAGQSIRCVQE